MWNKQTAVAVILFFFALINCSAQDCNLTLEGFVFDETSDLPLSYVNVIIQENSKGSVTDDDGRFFIPDLCSGHYHVYVSHIGCETQKLHLELSSDTLLHIVLDHSEASLGTVVVTGKTDKSAGQAKLSVNRRTLEDNTNKNLSAMLENEAGVHLIKNGAGISKPVVHGLYGNRLSILNNGVIQSGQQWGNDHTPEIDPYAADEISVLKGASAIQYGAGNLGSIILVEPKRISREPHLHGQINYTYETNGRGNTLNARLGKYSPLVAWRASGTFKKYGDKTTPDYFLNNTGLSEANLSLQLEKTWNQVFFLDFYGSTFNTKLGVLRGSHIGNVAQLEEAITKDVPFFTEEDFSYALEAPRQNVSHHLLKLKSKYFFNDNQIFEAVIAGQINDRKEFDIRRGERENIPSLSLLQYALNVDFLYSHTLESEWKFKIGNQSIITDNTNNPETDIFPLIPDYRSWKTGVFSTLSKRWDALYVNAGLRYDFEYQDVAAFTNEFPREVIRYDNLFNNLNGIITGKYNLTKEQFLSLNLGYTMRNPGINELYSNGLHQGVSGIEEGDTELIKEKALKGTVEYKWVPNTYFTIDALAYYQVFDDYIFLNPTGEIRPTIRGAFPVFKYEQTDANIYGLDLSTQFTIQNAVQGVLKYSYLKGTDTTKDKPLVFMSPNRLFVSLSYQMNTRVVFEQSNILADQDFLLPPSTYSLLGLKFSTNIISPKNKLRCYIKADNLLNARFRDYLNRQRYFADDLGRSIVLGLNFKF